MTQCGINYELSCKNDATFNDYLCVIRYKVYNYWQSGKYEIRNINIFKIRFLKYLVYSKTSCETYFFYPDDVGKININIYINLIYLAF